MPSGSPSRVGDLHRVPPLDLDGPHVGVELHGSDALTERLVDESSRNRIPDFIDVSLTGLVIGGRSKLLHDLIT